MLAVKLKYDKKIQTDYPMDKDPYAPRVLPARYLRPKRKLNTKVKDNQSFNIYLAAGTVQTYPEVTGDSFGDERYTTFSAVLDYQHKFNNMHGVTAGVDCFYDGSLEERFADDNNQQYLAGIHGDYDFMFPRFMLCGHVGTYLTENRGKDLFFYKGRLTLQNC